MDLRTYIQTKGEDQAATLFCVSIWTVRSWRSGNKKPRPAKANEIVAKTGGEVSLAGIYAQKRPAGRPRAG